MARVAIWEELRRRPDAPDQRLLTTAKEAIWKERLRGKSVDGRLNPATRRPHRYATCSLDAPYLHDGPALEEMLASGPVHAHDLWESPVEGEAVGRVLYEELRRLLTDTQEAFLTLLLCGYQSQDAGHLLGMTKQQAHVVRLSVQRVACDGLGIEYPGLRSRSRRRRETDYAVVALRAPPVPSEVK